MIRTGIGYDIHRLVKGRSLVLGGVQLPYHLGLEGHSDADALCHAIMDALLGSVAAGDIGNHFPDSDSRWKNADSMVMLKQVGAIVREKGYLISNLDAMIMAEAPRLAPYTGSMRTRIAEALEIEMDQVSVKAGTNEKLGAIGRGEGIGVLAIAAVCKENRRM